MAARSAVPTAPSPQERASLRRAHERDEPFRSADDAEWKAAALVGESGLRRHSLLPSAGPICDHPIWLGDGTDADRRRSS